MTTKYTRRTLIEIEDLKADWLEDPCWDIETTEGFEAHKRELKKYRLVIEAKWESNRQARIAEKAKRLNCSLELADYILFLERRLEALEEKVTQS